MVDKCAHAYVTQRHVLQHYEVHANMCFHNSVVVVAAAAAAAAAAAVACGTVISVVVYRKASASSTTALDTSPSSNVSLPPRLSCPGLLHGGNADCRLAGNVLLCRCIVPPITYTPRQNPLEV